MWRISLKMLKRNEETFIACDAEYGDAQIVLFGAPFDSTTSFRPGTRFGPKAIRSESFGIETYSPYLDKDMTDYSFFDSGDLELCFGNTESALADIEERVNVILKDGKIPFMLGGEHLVTLPALKAVHNRYSDVHIIHFDAHADLRDDYLGAKLSHAAVMRRCWEIVGDDKIYQFGIRSGDRDEFKWGKSHVETHKFSFEGLGDVVEKLKGKKVYFTLDLDVLDPSVFSGTGTPEAGGVTFNELREAIKLIFENVEIVGMDAVELSPHYDMSGVSTATACKIVREMLLSMMK